MDRLSFSRAAGEGLDKNKISRPVARRWFRDWRFTGLIAATAEARAQQACIIAIMALAQLSSTGVFSARFTAAPLRSTRHSVSLWPGCHMCRGKRRQPLLSHNVTTGYNDEFAHANMLGGSGEPIAHATTLDTRPESGTLAVLQVSASRAAGVIVRAERASWLPGAELPSYLNGATPNLLCHACTACPE